MTGEKISADTLGNATGALTQRGIVQVYRGQPGCACGCRGNYSDKLAAVTRARNEALARIREHENSPKYSALIDVQVDPAYVSLDYLTASGNARVLTIYLQDRVS